MKKYKVMNKMRRNWRQLKRILNRKTSSDRIVFTDDMVRRFIDVHRELQAVIAIVSNYRAGINIKSNDFRPRAIYKYEGGVLVDEMEIVIKRSRGIISCYDDCADKETDISKIVKEVVEEILSIEGPDPLLSKTTFMEDILTEYAVRNTDMSEEILRKNVSRFTKNPFGGDPLHRLLET